MNDFVFCCPTKFVFGRGYVNKIGKEAALQGWKRGMIFYGGGSVERTGTLDKVRMSLMKAGIEFVEFAGIRPNPEVNQVRKAIEVARKDKVDFLLPVGGGSTIDVAKATAYGVPYFGDVWDFHEGKAQIRNTLPIACVLTIPAAGSESSSSCVISNDKICIKKGTDSPLNRPKLAIMDPELTFTLPQYQTAAGVTDMIAHICERYFSRTGRSEISDNISTGLVKAIMKAAIIVQNEPKNYNARATIMWGSTLAHNDLTSCGLNHKPEARAGGWESHGIEHVMSAVNTNVIHGAGLAVIMPLWMRYVWREDPQRFLSLGRKVFDIEPEGQNDAQVEKAVLETIDSLQAFFIKIGMPKDMAALDLNDKDIEPMLESLECSNGKEFGLFKKINLNDVRKIFESAL
ncbi:MAG: iron-containing alcohol dehydrogenase [Eggerthellaceae bacterium]|nr:iron-containing alcohol dehydrogenase [Eggerthellaceae bacterium]